uniref:Transglutaminase-like domain-containing protein n=1 Tax=Timema douglasi TaxID=61478 RepID=A0A7R8ZBU8_TIMDO|nr:unnamed protein product [Timema douglasi]
MYESEKVPECLMSPTAVLSIQEGYCFEYSTLLVSILIGSGYDAYVVSGYATREFCMNDQSMVDCPHLVKELETDDSGDGYSGDFRGGVVKGGGGWYGARKCGGGLGNTATTSPCTQHIPYHTGQTRLINPSNHQEPTCPGWRGGGVGDWISYSPTSLEPKKRGQEDGRRGGGKPTANQRARRLGRSRDQFQPVTEVGVGERSSSERNPTSFWQAQLPELQKIHPHRKERGLKSQAYATPPET